MSEHAVEARYKMADASAIPTLVKDGDAANVQAEIEVKYGFRPTLDYCRDLIAFVDAMTETMTDADARD